MPGGTDEAVPRGRRVRVRTPATCANLGAGYDCFGLALDWADETEVVVHDGPDEAHLTGEGVDDIPTDGRNLILRSVRTGLAELGATLSGGLRLVAHNTIPHGRGLGSSSSAIVTGLLIAWQLVHPHRSPDRDWLLRWAGELEGHPDNVAAAIHGGFALAWGAGADVRAISAALHPDLAAVVFIPETPLPTGAARGLLPANVPHADAAANASRAALLVLAIATRPDLLLPATEDWLHQRYRADAMRPSSDLVAALRAAGHPATVSGAGPTVLVLGERSSLAGVEDWQADGFRAVAAGVGSAAQVVAEDAN